MVEVRQALKDELLARGLDVADDTYSPRGEIYVKGTGDLAAALFEFKESADEAAATMYQGHWSAGMPLRVAVLPQESQSEPSFELLSQMGIRPLLHRSTGGSVVFPGLDEVLGRITRRE